MYDVESGNTERLPWEQDGLDRRDFVKVITAAAAAVGIGFSLAEQMAEAAVQKKLKPSVVWLHFQECTGCTESLLRTSHPALSTLILDLVSLDYHETLLAAAGHQAEKCLAETMKANEGKYVLVIEGAIPVKENGIYCKIGGKTALELANTVAAKAGAVAVPMRKSTLSSSTSLRALRVAADGSEPSSSWISVTVSAPILPRYFCAAFMPLA